MVVPSIVKMVAHRKDCPIICMLFLLNVIIALFCCCKAACRKWYRVVVLANRKFSIYKVLKLSSYRFLAQGRPMSMLFLYVCTIEYCLWNAVCDLSALILYISFFFL